MENEGNPSIETENDQENTESSSEEVSGDGTGDQLPDADNVEKDSEDDGTLKPEPEKGDTSVDKDAVFNSMLYAKLSKAGIINIGLNTKKVEELGNIVRESAEVVYS